MITLKPILMAKIDGGHGAGFRGNIDGLSYYKMKGVEKTIVRKSGGHPKSKQKRNRNLDLFCRAGSEFGGRSVMASYINGGFWLHKPAIDYRVSSTLTAVLKPLQELDTVSDLGQRNLYLSLHKHFLKGFSLTRKHHFDTVITHPVECSIDRASLSAQVNLPELIPGINFYPPVNFPYYRLVATLKAVPDVVYRGGRYASTHDKYSGHGDADAFTPWYSLQEGSAPVDLELHKLWGVPDDHFTLVLTLGICYGTLKTLTEIDRVPFGGSARVLEVG